MELNEFINLVRKNDKVCSNYCKNIRSSIKQCDAQVQSRHTAKNGLMTPNECMNRLAWVSSEGAADVTREKLQEKVREQSSFSGDLPWKQIVSFII